VVFMTGENADLDLIRPRERERYIIPHNPKFSAELLGVLACAIRSRCGVIYIGVWRVLCSSGAVVP
jgi:hypothetical protein